MTGNKDVPRVFALTRNAGGQDQIVGYGMVLPDGSAYSVAWPAGRHSSLYSASSAEETTELRSADLVWMSDPP